MTEKKPLNIHQRMLKVMQEVTYIQKEDRVGDAIGNYAYAKHDKVVAAVRPILLKRGVIPIHTLKSSEYTLVAGDKRVFCTCTVSGRFINADDPQDFIEVEMDGHGVDSSDKSIGKAASYAKKNLLLMVLLLETGEDEYPSNLPVGDASNVRTVPDDEPVTVKKLLYDDIVTWTGVAKEDIAEAAKAIFKASKADMKNGKPSEAGLHQAHKWVTEQRKNQTPFMEAIK